VLQAFKVGLAVPPPSTADSFIATADSKPVQRPLCRPIATSIGRLLRGLTTTQPGCRLKGPLRTSIWKEVCHQPCRCLSDRALAPVSSFASRVWQSTRIFSRLSSKRFTAMPLVVNRQLESQATQTASSVRKRPGRLRTCWAACEICCRSLNFRGKKMAKNNGFCGVCAALSRQLAWLWRAACVATIPPMAGGVG